MNLARNWQLFSDYLKSQSASMQLDRRGADLLAALQQCVRPSTQRPSVEIPARQRVMGDWFLEGDLGFIHAPRGVGKTWMALGLATAIAGGRDFGPWASGGVRRVLYVDGEMPCEALDERIASMGGSKDLIVLNHEELFHLTGELLNFTTLMAELAGATFFAATAVFATALAIGLIAGLAVAGLTVEGFGATGFALAGVAVAGLVATGLLAGLLVFSVLV